MTEMPPIRRPTAGNLAARTVDRTEPTDDVLVRDVLAGNRDAFAVLVRRHEKGVLGYVSRLTGDRESAADVAQEAFIKAYCALGTFDPAYRFSTWLYRIASNAAVDHLRRRNARPHGHPSTSGPTDAGARRDLVGAEPSPDEVLRCREIEARLEEEIAALPPRYRQLLLLRHRLQMRYDEIARVARLPIGTVKNRIFRAREILRERLSDVLDGEVR